MGSISQLFINGNPGPNVRINHACLIGYDYIGYNNVYSEPHSKLKEKFEYEFLSSCSKLVDLLQKKLDKFEKKHLIFDVFFLPFPSVVDFRNAFNEALD